MEDKKSFCQTERVVGTVCKQLLQNIQQITKRNHINNELSSLCPKIYERYWSEMSEFAINHQSPKIDGKIIQPRRIVSQSGEQLKDKYYEAVLRRSVSKTQRLSKQIIPLTGQQRIKTRKNSRLNLAKYNKIIPLSNEQIPQEVLEDRDYERRIHIFRMKKEKLEEAMKAFKQEDKIIEEIKSNAFNCKTFKPRASFTTDFKGKLLNFSKSVSKLKGKKEEEKKVPTFKIHTQIEPIAPQSCENKEKQCQIGSQRSSKLINYTNIQQICVVNENVGRKTDKPISPLEYITSGERNKRPMKKSHTQFKKMREKGASAKSGFCNALDLQSLKIPKDKFLNANKSSQLKGDNVFSKLANIK